MANNFYNSFRRITTNQLYFPEIDGIRFLAIFLVILFHIHGYFMHKSALPLSAEADSYPLIRTLCEHGDRGVMLFFVLSGFILCLPFAHYYLNNGQKVILKKYYLRRLTRLEPPYILALTAIFIMHLFLGQHPPAVLVPHWLASLAYSHNWIYNHVPMLTVVAWSLEVEIQFYLLAPLLFTVLRLPKTPRRLLLAAAIVAFVALNTHYPAPVITIYGSIQYFLAGILLADLYVTDSFTGIFNRFYIIIPATLSLLLVIYLPFYSPSLSPGTLLLIHAAFPFLVAFLYYAILKNNLLKRIFSYKFIPIIGGMCYSIYLLHYTIISFIGRFTIGCHITAHYLPNLLLQLVLLCIPILVISSIFFFYIERPFMAGKWLDMLLGKNKKEAGINSVK